MEPFVQTTVQEVGVLFLSKWMEKDPGLTAGISSRRNGHSDAPFASLNCGLHVGDDAQRVVLNRQALAKAVGVPLEQWTFGEQVHGCRVQRVAKDDAGRGILTRDDAFQGADAFVTDEPGLVLGGLFADCVPLYFFDPVRRAVGLAHAGWRGTVLKVAEKTIMAMQEQLGSRPEELWAAIGPSIGRCCYEVDESVATMVRTELNGLADTGLEAHGTGKFRLDLQELNRQIMIKAGILPFHIEISTRCTGCRPDLFFSHRREQGRTGRMAAWIGLKEADKR